MKLQKRHLIALPVVLGTLFFAAESCDDTSNQPDSDSSVDYESGAEAPVDDNVYTVKGEVVGPVNELTRQVEPAHGSGTAYGSSSGFYGSSTFTGPISEGKSFIRLLVDSSDPETKQAPPGEVTIIKTTDTKAAALQPGDVVTFKCRRDYENVAAVKENEDFDEEKVGTWELDYCRMYSSVIEVK